MSGYTYITDMLIDGLGVTLLNSVWQGLVIALVLAGLLRIFPKAWVQLKYWLSVTALVGLLFWTGYTFIQELTPEVTGTSFHSTEVFTLTLSETPINITEWNLISGLQAQLNLWLTEMHPYMDTLVVIWVIGVMLFLLRLQGSMIYLKRLQVMGTQPVSIFWQHKVNLLSDQLGIHKKIKIVESAIATVPMVIGHFKPMILIPVGMLTGLSTKEVEAILVHELAHIKRVDYLINIIQTVIESLLFFNPAVWWISQAIRKHREHCCDDIAVRYCGNQLEYANALTNLGAWSLKTPALGMGLFKNKNELLMRIKRLVCPQVGERTIKEKYVPATVLMLTVLCLTWYSHKVQAHIVMEAPSTKLADFQFTQQVNDTVPANQEEELPPMDPELVEDEPLTDEELNYNIDVHVAVPDIEVEIPDMDVLVTPPVPEFDQSIVITPFVMPDMAMAPFTQLDMDMHELMDLEQVTNAIVDMQVHYDDTTRERIRRALEAQREALEQVREAQVKAMEAAREQLKMSRQSEKPEDLTEEEWEMAKRQIERAEREVERAMKESQHALERAFEEEQQFAFHGRMEQFDREHAARIKSIQKHINRMAMEEDRIQKSIEKAQRNASRFYHSSPHPMSGKESQLRHKLLQDGLIDDYNSDISLNFTRNQVKINGVKLEGKMKEKYRELLDEMYGKNSTGSLEFED